MSENLNGLTVVIFKFFNMIANLIFGFILVCFIWGAIQNGVENLLSYALEIALTALVGAFLGWLIGLWYIGAIAGAVYCIYCWIFGKFNIFMKWWFCRG